MFYLSYKQLPELSKFSSTEKRIIWVNFNCIRNEHTLLRSWIYGMLIIIGLLVGWGFGILLEFNSLLFGILGTVISILLIQIFNVSYSREALQLYIESSAFSLKPVNQRAEFLLKRSKIL